MDREKAPPCADIISGSSLIARAVQRHAMCTSYIVREMIFLEHLNLQKYAHFFSYIVSSGANVASLAQLIN